MVTLHVYGVKIRKQKQKHLCEHKQHSIITSLKRVIDQRNR